MDRHEIRARREAAGRHWAIGLALAYLVGGMVAFGMRDQGSGLDFVSCFIGLPGGYVTGWAGAHSHGGMAFGTVVSGAAILATFGSILGRQQPRLWPVVAGWAVFAVTVTAWAILQYDTVEDAVAKNGSLLAYAWFGGMVSLQVVPIVAALVVALLPSRTPRTGAGSRRPRRSST